jgi:parvulin-like peptidyl-prolyl isomerase
MKNIVILLCLMLVLPHSYADEVVAEYNNKQLHKSEVEDNLKTLLNGQLPNNKKKFDDFDPETKSRFIQEMVSQRVIEDAADKSDLQNNELYKKQMIAVQKQVKVNLFLEHYANKKISDSLLKTEYKNYVKSLKDNDDIHVQHILVKTEEEAQKLLDEINSGKVSFEDAAKKFSLDTGSKDKGGDLGFMSKGQTVPEFEQAAYALKKGKVSKPVKTQYGYHLIKLIDSRPKKIPTFDEMKPHLKNALSMKIKQQYVADLLTEAKTKIYPGTAK